MARVALLRESVNSSSRHRWREPGRAAVDAGYASAAKSISVRCQRPRFAV